MSVQPSKLSSGVSPQPVPRLTEEDLSAAKVEQQFKAKYKIEIIFSKHRSSRLGKSSPLMLLVWESGKKLHGGGDQKMYWCGYDNCSKLFSSDNFAYMHTICPHCKRELFLDIDTKRQHISQAIRNHSDVRGLQQIPLVVGEVLYKLTPSQLAALLEKTWRQLDGDADIYLKYSPHEIRYDPKEEKGHKLSDKLDQVRVQRKPLIYTLKNIMKDLHAGAELRKRFLSMITS